MAEQSSNDLEEPDRIRTPNGERRDGRPSGDATSDPMPADHGVAPPTEAPEEKGGSPSTEHAPGGDL